MAKYIPLVALFVGMLAGLIVEWRYGIPRYLDGHNPVSKFHL